jgi:hypothetical protein
VGVEVRFEDVFHELKPGDTLRFGRGSESVAVDLVLSNDRHLHACAGSITANADGWVLTNLGSHLVLRLSELPTGGSVDVHPSRSVLCPWPSASVAVTIRNDAGPTRYVIEVESDPIFGMVQLGESDGGTVIDTGINRNRTYYRVLVELCRPRLEDASATHVPEAKEVARRLGMTARAVEKHIEYLRVKYGFGPDRLFAESNAGLEQRGTQQQFVDIAILSGDVSLDDVRNNDLA